MRYAISNINYLREINIPYIFFQQTFFPQNNHAIWYSFVSILTAQDHFSSYYCLGTKQSAFCRKEIRLQGRGNQPFY